VISPLSAWQNFYVIIGSSAAALTGLQFIVVTLVAQVRARSSATEIETFGTPTVVHFGAVLLLSALLSAPWATLASPGLALIGCGLTGVGYSALVIRRATRQKRYELVFEDWLWHAILPFFAYTVLLVAAVAVARQSIDALFVIGATSILLLFVGIHNAWDTVTYVVAGPLPKTEVSSTPTQGVSPTQSQNVSSDRS
jgi:hypothetical protein